MRNAAATGIRQQVKESFGDSGIKTILLVDDEDTFLRSLSEVLGIFLPGNFRTVTAGNGGEALRVLSSLPVDLVLTDLKMPIMDGFQLVAHLREKHCGIPVIVMSASIGYEEEDRLLALGVTHCLEKPLDLENLTHLIVDQLSGTRKKADPTGMDRRDSVTCAA